MQTFCRRHRHWYFFQTLIRTESARKYLHCYRSLASVSYPKSYNQSLLFQPSIIIKKNQNNIYCCKVILVIYIRSVWQTVEHSLKYSLSTIKALIKWDFLPGHKNTSFDLCQANDSPECNLFLPCYLYCVNLRLQKNVKCKEDHWKYYKVIIFTYQKETIYMCINIE